MTKKTTKKSPQTDTSHPLRKKILSIIAWVYFISIISIILFPIAALLLDNKITSEYMITTLLNIHSGSCIFAGLVLTVLALISFGRVNWKYSSATFIAGFTAMLLGIGVDTVHHVTGTSQNTYKSGVVIADGAAYEGGVLGDTLSGAGGTAYEGGAFGDVLWDAGGAIIGSISSNHPVTQAPSYVYSIPSQQIVQNDKYDETQDNAVKVTKNEPVSTFSIDVDTASYTNVRAYLDDGQMPPKDAVRIEELINYFPYNYALPKTKEQPFAIHTTLTESPWKKDNKLLHIGIKGYDVVETVKKPLNIVLLIDTSGSMYGSDRLELLQRGFLLLADELTEKDTISIVTYSGDSRVALEPTKGNQKSKIRAAINSLNASGGTWGAGGLKTAYELAKDNYDENAVNRILLGTDGDFNIGTTDNMSLSEYVSKQKEDGIYLSILSVGRGNYNDSLTQSIAQAGNGIAYYLDSFKEARRVLLTDINKTMFPIANDVKIQVEFNPAKVAEYRLIGYETRLLNREDFNNDQVDAGEIGSGHSVTAIYELTPTDSANRLTEDLRYGSASDTVTTQQSDETAFVRVRYKLPEGKESKLIEQPVISETALDDTSDDVRFSIAVAGFGQNLKNNKYRGNWSYNDIKAFAKSARGEDDNGYRSEFIGLIDAMKTIKTEPNI